MALEEREPLSSLRITKETERAASTAARSTDGGGNMARGITFEWDKNIYGKSVLVIRKARGKLTLSEIEELLRYENRGAYNGRYAILVNCAEATCGGAGWGDETEQRGDTVALCEISANEDCPVCGAMLPEKDYCPHCGESLRTERG